jgi:hypothetical protein
VEVEEIFTPTTDTAGSIETSNFYPIMQHHILVDNNLHSDYQENLKSCCQKGSGHGFLSKETEVNHKYWSPELNPGAYDYKTEVLTT